VGFARRVFAQSAPPTGVKRIAIFSPTEPPERLRFKAYFDELNRLGYIEGENLIVERYSALGQLDRVGDFAREIVASHPDVILPFTSIFIKEVMKLNSSIPMVGPMVDPIPYGFTTSLARPDRNFTGVIIDAGLEIWGKRVQLLLETAPKMTKVGYFAADPSVLAPGPATQLAQVHDAAQRAGVATAFVVVAGMFDRAAYERADATVVVGGGERIDRAAYERTFDLMKRVGVDGIAVGEHAENYSYAQTIVDLAAKFRIPAIYPARNFVEVGGLMAYGVDISDEWRRIGGYDWSGIEGHKGKRASVLPANQIRTRA
jgi:putative ABC transport system substrate-binding protein